MQYELGNFWLHWNGPYIVIIFNWKCVLTRTSDVICDYVNIISSLGIFSFSFFLANPVTFCLVLFFASTNLTEKLVGFSWIKTWNVGVKGTRAEHLTTTTAQMVLSPPHIATILWHPSLAQWISTFDPFSRVLMSGYMGLHFQEQSQILLFLFEMINKVFILYHY